MNTAEAATIVNVLTSAWPNSQWPDATVDLWFELLEPLDYQYARAAMGRVVLTVDRVPTVARFREIYGAELARATTTTDTSALPAAKPSKDFLDRMLTACRAAIASKVGDGKHWHGGPNPCPVCGGMKGTLGLDYAPSTNVANPSGDRGLF